jgi:hypothetical protein
MTNPPTTPLAFASTPPRAGGELLSRKGGASSRFVRLRGDSVAYPARAARLAHISTGSPVASIAIPTIAPMLPGSRLIAYSKVL